MSTHSTVPVRSPFSSGVGVAATAHEDDEDMLRRLNGHHFQGQKQDLLPHGAGEYTFRNGTVYEGSFDEGTFHGAGCLTFPGGAQFDATWSRGRLVGGVYSFDDKLEYKPENWHYCTDADRRFWSEHQQGIAFAQHPQLTDNGERDTSSIPAGTYDLGDCYLNPKDNKLYNYDGSSYRDPTPEELAWAKRKTRIGLDPAPTTAAQ